MAKAGAAWDRARSPRLPQRAGHRGGADRHHCSCHTLDEIAAIGNRDATVQEPANHHRLHLGEIDPAPEKAKKRSGNNVVQLKKLEIKNGMTGTNGPHCMFV